MVQLHRSKLQMWRKALAQRTESKNKERQVRVKKEIKDIVESKTCAEQAQEYIFAAWKKLPKRWKKMCCKNTMFSNRNGVNTMKDSTMVCSKTIKRQEFKGKGADCRQTLVPLLEQFPGITEKLENTEK